MVWLAVGDGDELVSRGEALFSTLPATVEGEGLFPQGETLFSTLPATVEVEVCPDVVGWSEPRALWPLPLLPRGLPLPRFPRAIITMMVLKERAAAYVRHITQEVLGGGLFWCHHATWRLVTETFA